MKFSYGRWFIEQLSDLVTLVLSYGQSGLSFVFGSLALASSPSGFLFAFQVLGNIVFIAALVGALSYLGIISFVVKKLGWCVGKVVGTTQVESFVAVANMFMGQTDSPILISKYIRQMTKSELMLIMIAGMGSMSVVILGGYVALGIPMQYLLIASALVPLASVAIGKVILPETEESVAVGKVKFAGDGKSANLIDAIVSGAMDGMQVAFAIGAALIAIIGLVALVNGFLGNFGLTLEVILSYVFAPLGYLMGLEQQYILTAGQLLGSKLVLNEFVAFDQLGKIIGSMDERTAMMLSISLAGFANISSMGISVSAISVFCPEKRGLLAQLVFKAMLGGFGVSVLNAMIVGFILMF